MFNTKLFLIVSFLSVLASAVDKPTTHSTICRSSELVAFVKLDTQQTVGLMLGDSHSTVIDNRTLVQCSTYCKENIDQSGVKKPCAGFSYSAPRQICMLTNIPFVSSSKHNFIDNTRDNIRSAGDLRGGDSDSGHYGKVCFRASTDSHLPSNAPVAFRQIANRVLTKSTEEVVIAEDMSQCLAMCLESVDIFDFFCNSAMFFYESGNCLLNSMAARYNLLHLSNETENLRVDYFENLIIGHKCTPGTVPQYVYLSNSDMVNAHDFVIEKVSKATCENYCSMNKGAQFNSAMCKSFAYDERKRTCYLMNEQASPRGKGQIKKIEGVEIYEKVCLSVAQTCTKTPAFERVPMHVLVGFAQIVLENVGSEESCLSECLSSYANMGFDCMSVMYYMDTKECILNFDSRLSNEAQAFFSNNTEGFNVDYYDNLCGLRLRDAGQAFNTCPDRTASTYIQFNDTEMSQFATETLSVADMEECLHKCEAVKNFTCNSVDFDISDNKCTLSFIDSRTSSLLPAVGKVHLERHCIEGLKSCQDKPISFVAEAGLKLIGGETLSVLGMSLDECLSLCLLDPTQNCQSVNYGKRDLKCQLNNGTITDKQLVADPDNIYFENACFQTTPINDAVIGQSMVANQLADQAGIQIDTDCQYSSMKVKITSQQPFTGYFFAKNKFYSCGVQVQNSASAQLALSFPTFPGARSDCGVVETSKSKYSGVVVVTMNNLGIPGLVAEGDKFFNITCDYSSSFQNRVTAKGVAMSVSNPSLEPLLHPDGIINIPSPIQMEMRKTIATQGPVHMVEVGEQVTMDILYAPGFNQSMMEFFIRQCNASRHYGPPPEPEPLILIKDGCPTQAVVDKIIKSPVEKSSRGLSLTFTAFRFDGSNSVRMTCLVDMCEGHCNPTSCNINGQQVASYGRKKRDAFNSTTKKTQSNSLVFTVVDRMPVEAHDTPTVNKLERLRQMQNESPSYSKEYIIDAKHRKQICLKRSTFFGVFVFLSILCVCQVIAIGIYTVRYFCKIGLKKSD